MTNAAQAAALEPGLTLESPEYRVLRGPYLGDVSALCFLPSTPSSYLIAGSVLNSSFSSMRIDTQFFICFFSEFLLSTRCCAGTGPQVLVYDLVRGDLLLSQQVFDGVRVHGIYVRRESKILAVHGEGRVKVLKLQSNEKDDLKLSLLQSLPRFFQWILDVRFLQVWIILSSRSRVQGFSNLLFLMARV